MNRFVQKKQNSLALSRQQWIDACHFHPLSISQVLDQVYKKVGEVRSKALKSESAHPLVLLDLDSTLYEVAPRTLAIFKEWLHLLQTGDERQKFSSILPKLETIQLSHVGYSLRDTFMALGLEVEKGGELDPLVAEAWSSAKNFWDKRFFTNEYLKFDHAYDGAAKFAQELHKLGAEVVYLTGRDEPGMGDGTRLRLLQDGFPWDRERTHLLLKKHSSLDDLEHKQGAADYVRQHGTLVASFENEPPNLVALHDIFPESMHVFVDTIYSDRAAEPRQGLYRIASFV